MTDLVHVPNDGVDIQSRAKHVSTEVRKIKAHLVNNLLYLGTLLSEARANDYPQLLGFDTFALWLEDSGLDMSERQAYYLIKIVDGAKQLEIPLPQLEASKLSKLKEIFALDLVTHGDSIKQLVADSAALKLHEVRDRVQALRSEQGLEPTSWLNFRVTESQAGFIHEALAKARMEYGQVVVGDEVIEATDGTLLADVICTTYIQDINEREFQDSTCGPCQGDIIEGEVDG